jgi:anhydro-N-acetylmuramic acid kinase
LTGAEGQRILGRLTPGRPSNWRQLVRVMADFHPAPMKLKDAV